MTYTQSKINLSNQRIMILEADNTKVKVMLSKARSKIDLLEQRIIMLEAENIEVKAENAERGVEIAKLKAESLQEVKTRERIEKTMLDLDGCLYRKSLSMK
ncbi:hypothetical protein Glove_344g18 [Diversispora epigaea]|uniref:Uncharacterized protein n=1 Tax=Diversispora epigaea TaxID=1348612 RepID=A0A397HGM1_9GLOM|nr:hypothetical protein Glove_344g15 [Diversispora epigaea]RHZ62042.1 hypothetical protein Glove_344g18 [Diversispora epigaea]